MTDAITGNTYLSDLSVSQKYPTEKKESEELGQKAFLKLMITQMENQDPLSPQENSDFIAQLAQFSSVESLDTLSNNFDAFTKGFVGNQALQASSLVGRSVTVPAETTRLEDQSAVNGLIDVPASTGNVTLDIFTRGGDLVEQIQLGAQQAGQMAFRWDGKAMEVNGKPLDWQSEHENGLPPGEYKFAVTASIDGEPTQLQTSLSANVNSVTVGAQGGLFLNLAGAGSVKLSDVKQFNE